MRNRKAFLWLSITAVALFLLLAVLYYGLIGGEDKKTVNISVILYGGNISSQWENLQLGAEQAAKDLGAEINIVKTDRENDIIEQAALIAREINNGASALMIAACDSERMKEYLDYARIKIPVIMIESGVGEENATPVVSADNYAMGKALGEAIVEQESPQIKVAIIGEHRYRDSVARRYEGLTDALAGKIEKQVVWSRNENEQNFQPMIFLQRELTEEAVDVVVALDNLAADAIIDATKNLNKSVKFKSVKIYAIANTDKAVFYLDEGVIETLIYENEFSIGYLGVKKLLGEMDYENDALQKMVEFREVTKQDMYTDGNQKLLFPFVK